MPCLHNRPTLYTFMILIHISPKNEKGCFEKLNTIVKQDNKDFSSTWSCQGVDQFQTRY